MHLPSVFTLGLAARAAVSPQQQQQQHDAAPAAAKCSREVLQEAIDRYVAAQGTGKTEWLGRVMAANATLLENHKLAEAASSRLGRPMRIDYSHSIYDLEQCAAFTELIATDPADPWVVGAQIRLAAAADGSWKIAKLDRVATTTGDWLFNATRTLHYSLLEEASWEPIVPAERRDRRETLLAAANAYFDVMHDPDARAPWGLPCTRLEGGSFTGTGSANDTCAVYMPSNPAFIGPDRRFVIDETVGAVSVMLLLSGFGNAPDSHLFRLEDGKFHRVRTMTFCEKKPNCGIAPPEDLGSDVDPGY